MGLIDLIRPWWRKEDYLVNDLEPPPDDHIRQFDGTWIAKSEGGGTGSFSQVIAAPTNPQLVTHGLNTVTPLVQLRSPIGGDYYDIDGNMFWSVVDANSISVSYAQFPSFLSYPLHVTVLG